MMFSLFQFSTAEQIGLGSAGAALVAGGIGGQWQHDLRAQRRRVSATVGLVDSRGRDHPQDADPDALLMWVVGG
jgi:lactate permease